VTVKIWVLVAVPAGVVTVTGPLPRADCGTVAVMCASESTVNRADLPAIVTDVAPARALPLIATELPRVPLVGEIEEIVGAWATVTVKLGETTVAASPIVTVIGPVEAPFGTVVVICMPPEFTEKADETPDVKVTVAAPLRPLPFRATLEPTGPLAGLIELITGTTEKLAELVAVPPGVVTLIGPVVAVLGTVAVICVPPELTA
jgi:hypothetical protein